MQAPIGVLVDALHVIRSGGTADELREVDPALPDYWQICEAPLEAPCDVATPATILATRWASQSDLNRAHRRRPPWSIMSPYSCWVMPVIMAASWWNDRPSVAPSLEVK